MYSDESMKKAHLEDFKRVLARLESEPETQGLDFRILVLKECIRRCTPRKDL